jgi:CxxC motif-containing protein
MSIKARIMYVILFIALNAIGNTIGSAFIAFIALALPWLVIIPALSRVTKFDLLHNKIIERFAADKDKTVEDNSFSEKIDKKQIKTDSPSQTIKQLILEAVDATLKDFLANPPKEAYSSGDGNFEWHIEVLDSNENQLFGGTVECSVSILEDVIMSDDSPSLVEDDVRECFKNYLYNSEQAILFESAEQVDLEKSNFHINVYEVVDGGADVWKYYRKTHYFDAINFGSDGLSSNNSKSSGSVSNIDAVKKVTRDPYDFNKLDDIFKSDKEVVMAAVTGYGNNLEYAADSLKADKEVVLAAVNNSGSALRFSADDLKEDPEIFIPSLRNYASLEDFPEQFKADKKFVLGAVAISGENLEYASDELKANKEIIKAAIKNDSGSLRHASEALRADKEIVLEAMKNGGVDFRHIDEKFKVDKEVVLEAVKSNNNLVSQISDELKADKEIHIAALESEGTFHIEYAPDSLKADKEFILSITQSYEYGYNALEYVSDEIKSDKELILSIIQSYEYGYCVFKYISDDLKEDKDFTIEAIKTNPECFEHIAGPFKDDKGIVLEYISNIKNKNECEIPEKYHTDKDVVLADLRNQGTLLGQAAEIGIDVDKELFLSILKRKLSDSEEYYAKSSNNRSDSGGVLFGILRNGFPDKFAADKEIMMFVIKNDYLCLRFASPELLQDEEILYEAIKKGRPYSIKESISDSFKADKEFISSASKINPDIISIANEEVMADHSLIDYWVKNGTMWISEDLELIREYKANKDLVLPIVKASGYYLQHASKELKADKDIVMAAVSESGNALEYASGELQADKEVVLAAINNDKEAIKYASWTLLTDIDFILGI